MMLKEKICQIVDALEAASDHLDYCGYGDSWERECAEHQMLPEQISNALATGKALISELEKGGE
jgi:hypothetical protein